MDNRYKYHGNMKTPAWSKSFGCDTPRRQIHYCYQSRQFVPETFDAVTRRTEQISSQNDANTEMTRVRPMLQKMKRVEEDHPIGLYPWLAKKNSSKVSSIQFQDYKTITIPVHVQLKAKCSKHGMDSSPPVQSSSHKDDLLINFDDIVSDIDAHDSTPPESADVLIPELEDEDRNTIARNFDINVTNEDGEDTVYEVTKTYNNQSQDTEEEILLEDEEKSNETMMITDAEPGEDTEKENKIEEDSLDLNVIESTNRLDVHSLKDKTSLARKTSMARRHRPTRSSMRHVADTADHFQDSTEPRPVIRKRRESSSDSDDTDTGPTPKARVIPKAAPRPALLVGLGDLQKSKLFKTHEKTSSPERPVLPELPSSPPPTLDNTGDITAEIAGTNSIQNGLVETGSIFDNLVDKNKSPNRITPTDTEIKNYSFTKPVIRDSDMPLKKVEKRKQNEVIETTPKPLVSALKPRPAPKIQKVATTPEQPAKPIWLTDPKLRKSMTALDRKPKEAKTEQAAPEWMKTSSEKRQQVRDKLQNSGLQRQSSRESNGATAPWMTEFKSRKMQANSNLFDMLDRNASVLDKEAKENQKNSALTAKLTENASTDHTNGLQPRKTVAINGAQKRAKENSSTTSIEIKNSKPEIEKMVTSTNKSESEKAMTSTNKPESEKAATATNKPESEKAATSTNKPESEKAAISKTEEISNKSVNSPRSTANDKYIPSWSRTSSLKKQPSINIGTPSVLVSKESFEEPQWKKDLAERKKARKISESENPSPVGSPHVDSPSQSSVPAWKREVLLRKQSRLSMGFRDEPEQKPEVAEWQKKAEERRARFSVHNFVRNWS